MSYVKYNNKLQKIEGLFFIINRPNSMIVLNIKYQLRE